MDFVLQIMSVLKVLIVVEITHVLTLLFVFTGKNHGAKFVISTLNVCPNVALADNAVTSEVAMCHALLILTAQIALKIEVCLAVVMDFAQMKLFVMVPPPLTTIDPPFDMLHVVVNEVLPGIIKGVEAHDNGTAVQIIDI